MLEDLEAAKALAVRAGAILLQHRIHPAVEWKGPDHPVTNADRAASRFLAEQLKGLFPEDGILSEAEPDSLERLSKRRVWIIDPLNGTVEYIKGLDEFAVMIGLCIDGAAAVGLIYQPAIQKLYYAQSGCGAFLNENRRTRLLRVSAESDPECLVMALSRSHPSVEVETLRSKLHISRTLTHGSLGLKVGLICEGRAHLYLQPGSRTSQWDTCAADVLLHEAGGRMTDLLNARFRYNVLETRHLHGVVATNGWIHERIIRTARREPRDLLP